MRLLCDLPRSLVRGHLGPINSLRSRVKQRVPLRLRVPPSRSFRPSTTSTVMANIFDSPPEKVYLPNMEVENLEEYRVGGYHPTIIGDTFHGGRYEVAHKLGFGGSSTIWLARDRQLQKYVALKILAAHEAESNEAEILRLLSSPNSNSHPGQRFVPLLVDELLSMGPTAVTSAWSRRRCLQCHDIQGMVFQQSIPFGNSPVHRCPAYIGRLIPTLSRGLSWR